MSRLVVPPSLATFEAESMRGDRPNFESSEGYTSRLAKYIPGEATAGYLALEKLLSNGAATKNAGANASAAIETTPSLLSKAALLTTTGSQETGNYLQNFWSALIEPSGIAFLFCLIFAPTYVCVLGRKSNNPDWKAQAAIAAAAFIVWAYAVEGRFLTAISGNIYHSEIAGMLLIFFSMAIALYEPKPRS